MNNKKEEIPLIVHQQLGKFFKFKDENVVILSPKGNDKFLIKITDKRFKKFHFTITDYKISEDTRTPRPTMVHYSGAFAPESKFSLEEATFRSADEVVQKKYSIWRDLLNAIDGEPDIFQDPILANYEKYYFDEYLKRETENQNPYFSPNEVAQIISELKMVSKIIDSHNEQRKDSNLLDIQEDINEVIEKVAQDSKSAFYRASAKIKAKIMKYGPTVIRFAMEEAARALINQGISTYLIPGKPT